MARNKSEKLPHEDPDVEPDFYKLLRIYAETNVERGVRTRSVRDGGTHWGVGVTHSEELFRSFTDRKKNAWWDWSDTSKQAYVADYMDYLYGT